MNVSVIDLSTNQKKLQVQVPADEVQKELESRYRDLSKRVRIKGFRPGKVPKNILKSYYGKSVENEVSTQFIRETFPQALRQADLKPLTEADVDEMHFEDNGTFTYSAIVDVSPPFELEGYKGLEIGRRLIEVKEERVDAELERIREQHAQLRTLESDRSVQKGDVVIVDFTPWVDGAVFEKGKTHDYMVEVGKGALHSDFDGHLIGRNAGDAFTVELDYPEDAPTREIAGKRVLFDVTLKELKEKILANLDDDFAQELGQHNSLEELKEEIRNQLRHREEDAANSEARQQLMDQLANKIEVELSSRIVEREIDRLVGLLQHQFESQGLKVDTSRFNSPEIRASYRPQAEKNLRWRLAFHKVAQLEGIELTDEDLEESYGEVARLLRTDLATVKREYADSSIVEQTRENKIQTKVLEFLQREAVYVEASQEEVAQQE